MDAFGFPPHLDLFKAMVARLVSDDGGPPLSITWLRKFLNRHPEHTTKISSRLNHQHALSSKPEPVKDYFRKLQAVRGQLWTQADWGWPGPTVVGLESTVGLAVAGQLWIYSWPGYGWPDIHSWPGLTVDPDVHGWPGPAVDPDIHGWPAIPCYA